jgi:hypothetical protein
MPPLPPVACFRSKTPDRCAEREPSPNTLPAGRAGFTGPSAALLTVLVGSASVLDLGTNLAGRALIEGQTVLYIDGANAFDPYAVTRLAPAVGQSPRGLLERLRLSRPFTCHQMETLIAERLPAALVRYRPGLVVVSGWSRLFHDENIPAREALRLFQNTARYLHRLAAAGQPILATHPETPPTPRLRSLGAIVTEAADALFRLHEEEGGRAMFQEKPSTPDGPRAIPISRLAFGSAVR